MLPYSITPSHYSYCFFLSIRQYGRVGCIKTGDRKMKFLLLQRCRGLISCKPFYSLRCPRRVMDWRAQRLWLTKLPVHVSQWRSSSTAAAAEGTFGSTVKHQKPQRLQISNFSILPHEYKSFFSLSGIFQLQKMLRIKLVSTLLYSAIFPWEQSIKLMLPAKSLRNNPYNSLNQKYNWYLIQSALPDQLQ